MWRRTLLGLVAVVLLIAACSGGSRDSVKYAPTVVPIKHLDLSAVTLTVADTTNPPFADQYPDIVAAVNGDDITGRALASKQVLFEMGKRQWSGQFLVS